MVMLWLVEGLLFLYGLSKLKLEKKITITDPNMTRFMMTLEDAVDLVLYAFEHGVNGDLFYTKSACCFSRGFS